MVEKAEAGAGPEDNFPKLASDQVIASEKLCAFIGVTAGARVLDIGGGNGHSALQAAIAAARRRAKVTAIHLKESVIELARARAKTEAVEGIEFLNADAAAMPFEDGSFDYVLSTLGLVFLADQEAAAKELARVVKPGGVIALTAFTRQSLPSQVYDLVGTIFANAPRPPRHHYEWSDGRRAGELLNPYFHAVRVQTDSYDSCFESPAAAFDMTSRWNPNIQMMLSRSTPDQADQMRNGFIAIAERANRATNGTYMGKMDYGIITGIRAG